MGIEEIKAIKFKSTPKKKESGKYLKRRSNKQAKIMRKLSKLYPKFLENRPLCKIKSPVCAIFATVVNHKKGRIGDIVFDQDFWEECCPPCNGYIEEHDAWAKENGHKVNRID